MTRKQKQKSARTSGPAQVLGQGQEYEQRMTGVVTDLTDNEIFVFGSNEAGRHGKGAALAARRWGAVLGEAEGLQGQTYGIPTKDSNVKKALSVGKIRKYVDRFIAFAKQNPQLRFLVTEIGCGLSGYSAADIAPLFRDALAVENIFLPGSFWNQLVRERAALGEK